MADVPNDRAGSSATTDCLRRREVIALLRDLATTWQDEAQSIRRTFEERVPAYLLEKFERFDADLASGIPSIMAVQSFERKALDVLERSVFQDLARPYSILPAEVARIAGEHLSVPPGQFEQAYSRFLWLCECIEGGTVCRRSDAFTVHTFDRADFFPGSRGICDLERPDDEHRGEEYEQCVHDALGVFRIRQVGLALAPAATQDDQRMVDMRLSVEGKCSSRAMVEAEQTLQPVLRSVFRTLSLAGHFECVNFEDGEEPRPDQTGFDLVRECLDLYFMPPSRKDSLAGRRLRNALRLLVEADAAQHSVVSLALCVSALEALVVGNRAAAISEELARNTATLLQHDPRERTQYVTAIKKLYDRRSRLLHGEQVEEDGDAAKSARKLVFKGIKAILEWRRWRRRLGAEAEPAAEFLTELRDNGMSGRAMMGVPEYLASY